MKNGQIDFKSTISILIGSFFFVSFEIKSNCFIDLCFSVGVMKNGRVEIIANDQGNRITPSYVAFTDEERLIGDAAKNQLTSNPENTIFDVKRLVGREWSDPNVQKDIKFFPFKTFNKNGKPNIKVQTANGEKV